MTELEVARFWQKVDKSGECWLWTGVRVADPSFAYGKVWRGNDKYTLAHRFSWELHNGAIPTGLLVLHHCDNPPCVRPDHLFVGTQRDNSHDMLAKGRWRGKARTACERGHPYTEASTHYQRRSRGTVRVCRICSAERARLRPLTPLPCRYCGKVRVDVRDHERSMHADLYVRRSAA